MDAFQRSMAVQSLWRMQPNAVQKSWYGQRINNVLDRQVERRSIRRLDEDLQATSDRDADSQHASLAMVRINCWAMPMLGFLGTVVGMVQAFDRIEEVGDLSPSVVAGGIKVALLTTVFGLVVAIILQIFYNYIVSKIDGIVNKMEDSSIGLLDIMTENNIFKK
jgi:biopolymer transport protein ExbB/TolQ